MNRYAMLFAACMTVMIILVIESRMTIYHNSARLATVEDVQRKIDEKQRLWRDELHRLNPHVVMPK